MHSFRRQLHRRLHSRNRHTLPLLLPAGKWNSISRLTESIPFRPWELKGDHTQEQLASVEMDVIAHFGHVVCNAGIADIEPLHSDVILCPHGSLRWIVPWIRNDIGAVLCHLDHPGPITIRRKCLRSLKQVQGAVRCGNSVF